MLSSINMEYASSHEYSNYYSYTTCNRSLLATLMASFSMFALFWVQTRALHLSHYAGKGMSPWFIFCHNLRLPSKSSQRHEKRSCASFKDNWLVKWLVKAVLPLADPYVCLTLARYNASNSVKMEGSLIACSGLTKKKLDLGERSCTDDGKPLFFDIRSARILIGAQVYLSLPETDEDCTKIKVGRVGILKDQQYPEKIPPLEVFPNMFVNSTSPNELTLTTANNRPSRILLNKAGKQALLELGLVPYFACLRNLKHSSNLEIIVLSSNAVGFAVNSFIRVHYGQSTISPLETLAFYVSVLICFNALVQLFFSGCTPLYKQTLLIHLSLEQFNDVISKRNDIKENKNLKQNSTSLYTIRHNLLGVGTFVLFFIACAIVGSVIYTNKNNVNNLAHSSGEGDCTACNWPINMMLYINYAIFCIVLVLLCCIEKLSKWRSWICSIWLVVSTIVMLLAIFIALYKTVDNWSYLGFDKPNDLQAWYHYAIPHIRT